VIDPGQASAVGFDVRGAKIRWTKDHKIHLNGASGDCPLDNGKLSLRILIDRSSIELFANNGQSLIAACYLPHPNKPVAAVTETGDAKFTSLKVRQLKSAWR
jgi:sucrose-6-phosphate hydrolase SacC (GH32 family)